MNSNQNVRKQADKQKANRDMLETIKDKLIRGIELSEFEDAILYLYREKPDTTGINRR